MARVRWIAGVSAILNVIGAQMDASSHDLDVQPYEWKTYHLQVFLLITH